MRRRRPRVWLALAVGVLVLYVTVGSSVAKYTSSTTSNGSFGSATCYFRATVQNGTATSSANGTTTVTITAVDPAKAFVLFSTRHNSARPVGSEVRGRVASATSLEFARDTDESSPVTITIEWSVIEYNCGVSVQRGSVLQSSTSVNVAITDVGSLARAFVTFSKSAEEGESNWADNDPTIASLTSTTNIQFRSDSATGHPIWWQVIAFTDGTKVNVQRGTTSLSGASTSVAATLSAVDTTKTFVLADTRSSGDGTDIGSGMVRARLTNATTITFDRSVANYDVTEISWQAVQLLDGSTVQSGNSNFGSGTSTATPTLTAVTLSRTSAFASTQTGGGQNGGRTPYVADDIIGVATAGLKLTSTTQLTLTRNNTSAAADVAWFVVSWGTP